MNKKSFFIAVISLLFLFNGFSYVHEGLCSIEYSPETQGYPQNDYIVEEEPVPFDLTDIVIT